MYLNRFAFIHHKEKVMSYYFSKTINEGLDKAKERVTEGLKEEGFGILTEIDVQATLKKKLDVDFRPYIILGACNPGFAYEALKAEQHIGTMLPCNVILQEIKKGSIEISAVDPVASMQAIDNKPLINVANEVRNKLQRVIEKL